MQDPFNILVAGVGGQGNLVCGRIIAEATILEGLQPVIGDTFGASRRGGGVVTHIRIGETDWGPLVPKREAHIILGLEPMEALRAAVDYAGPATTVMMSNLVLPVANVGPDSRAYPELEAITSAIESLTSKKRPIVLDIESVVKELGSTRVANTFMLGALTSLESPLTKTSLHRATKMILGHEETNIEAFENGVAYTKNLF